MSTHDAPIWFSPAAFDSAQQGTVTVSGTEIAHRIGGTDESQRILFVHGGRAHSAWWVPQVALLGDRAPRWATLDLSGHGASGWRDDYPPETWVDEVEAVALLLSDGQPITVVGHSLGGMLSIILASRGTIPIHRLVSIDAVPLEPGTSRIIAAQSRTTPVFPTLHEGATRFATHRSRQDWPAWLARFVGERSLRRIGDGWSWNHDDSRRVMHRPELLDRGALEPDTLTYVFGSRSPFRDTLQASHFLTEVTPDSVRHHLDTGHDVMMERPEEFHRILADLLHD